jgi:mannose-6-phosphate isomerase-like protein (cupin superfamily)
MTATEPTDLVVDPVFGTRYRFWREGDAQLVEMWVAPGGGVPAHIHPTVEEVFTVHEGTLELLAGREWRPARAGETVTVPPGTRHAFRNRGTVEAHGTCRATPPSSLEGFLTQAAGLSRAGLLTKAGLPKPRGILHAAVLAHAHRDMVHLLFPAPPQPVQKVLWPPLARLGEKRGLRAADFARL